MVSSDIWYWFDYSIRNAEMEEIRQKILTVIAYEIIGRVAFTLKSVICDTPFAILRILLFFFSFS